MLNEALNGPEQANARIWSSDLRFAGRESEVGDLRRLFANAGSRMVSGEAGSGKSRLVAEATLGTSSQVIVGHCAPETRNAAYGPFREIALRASRILDPAAVFGEGDQRSSDLGVLFPQMPVSDGGGGMTDDRRHGLWLAWLTYIGELASSGGLTLVVEDTHWADEESIALLRWMADQADTFALVATSRLPIHDDLKTMSAVELGPLSGDEIHSVLLDVDLTDHVSEAVGATGGVPLRIREWIQHHKRGVPSAVPTAGLAGLEPECLRVMAEASVIGTEIELGFVAELTGTNLDQLEAMLGAAQEVNVIERGRAGSFMFSHDTYREALALTLDPVERTHVHRRILAQMEDAHPDDPRYLPKLAYHAGEAARDGDRHDAVRLSLAAGDHALEVLLAPMSARKHYELAVEFAEMDSDRGILLAAELRLATAMVRSFDATAEQIIPRILQRADELGDSSAYAEAALLQPESRGPVALPYRGDFVAAARIRQSLARIDERDPLRGRLSAELALHQHASLQEDDFFGLVDIAESLAISTGNRDLDAAAFMARHGVRRPVGTLEDRLSEALERLNAEPPHSRWHLQYFDIAVASLLRSGQLGQVEDELKRLEARLSPMPSVAVWTVTRIRAAIAYAVGDLVAFEALATEAMTAAVGTNHADVAEMYFGFQIGSLMRERRMVNEVAGQIDDWVESDPTFMPFRAARAAQRSDSGNCPAALTDLAAVFSQDLQELVSRVDGLPLLEMATAAAVGCERADYCQMAWDLFEPFRAEWILIGGGSVLTGPVLTSMAMASSVVGEHERALSEIEEARAMTRRAGTSLHEWHTIRNKAMILRRSGDSRAAVEMFGLAQDRYQASGLFEQAEFCTEILNEMQAENHSNGHSDLGITNSELNSRMPDTGTALSGSIHREGRVWHLSLADETVSLSHVKGLTMLQALLHQPGRYLSASHLSALAEGHNSSAQSVAALRQDDLRSRESGQSVVDEAAISAYRERLEELTVELDRADRRENAEASARLSREFESLAEELSRVTGLGGKARMMGGQDERARVRVTKAIRGAIRRVEDLAPKAGQHLNSAISTGATCVYTADLRQPVTWNGNH